MGYFYWEKCNLFFLSLYEIYLVYTPNLWFPFPLRGVIQSTGHEPTFATSSQRDKQFPSRLEPHILNLGQSKGFQLSPGDSS